MTLNQRTIPRVNVLILFLAINLFFINFWLGVAEAKPNQTYSGKKIVPPSNTVEADSSEAMRQDKRFHLLVNLISLVPTMAAGVNAGYYLNPDSVIDADYSSAKFAFLGLSTTTTVMSVRYKSFHGNSFYWRGGVGLRTVKYEDDFDSVINSSTNYKFNGTANSTGIDFAIGNHWQWETYSMGCDWIGFFSPLLTSTSYTTSGSGDVESSKETLNRVGKGGHTQLLRFYLGVAF